MPPVLTRRRLLQGAGATTLVAASARFFPFRAAAFFPSAAQARAAQFQPALARLDEFILAHLRDVGAPGLTLALADAQGLLRASSYGLADVKAGTAVRPDMLFEIGSISKSFLAIALLQLRDEGKLDLQKPIKNYLPWLNITSEYQPITIHHLLSHTSGLPDDPLLIARNPLMPLWTGFAPGTHFTYSNTGYTILGILLEQLDGRPFADAMRARVFGPLGMNASSPVITNEVRARLPIGYAPFYDDRPFPRHGRLAEAPWVEVREATGSVAASPADMGAYLRLLLTRGLGQRGRLLSDESFALLVRPVIKAPFWGEDASYAYGLWVSDAHEHTLARHTGGMVAFSSAMHADLSAGFAAFASVNANLQGYRPNVVARYALDLLNAAKDRRALPALPAPAPPPARVKNAADYAGTYTATDGRQLVFAAEGERLLLTNRGQRVVLEQAGADRFLCKHPELELFTLAFGREGGKVVEAMHGGDWYVNEHYAGPRTFTHPPEWAAYSGHYRNDSPWAGSTRVVLRKGKLLLDGAQELFPLATGGFRVGAEEYSPERARFDNLMNGKAMRLVLSGVEFYRTDTP